MISSDLKHQLDNVHYLDSNNEIWFPKPLKVRIKNSKSEDNVLEFVCIKKVGKITKLCTVYSSTTLSNIHFMLQWHLYRVLLSMKDPRYPFDFEQVYEIETFLNK